MRVAVDFSVSVQISLPKRTAGLIIVSYIIVLIFLDRISYSEDACKGIETYVAFTSIPEALTPIMRELRYLKDETSSKLFSSIAMPFISIPLLLQPCIYLVLSGLTQQKMMHRHLMPWLYKYKIDLDKLNAESSDLSST
jgi:hypothetical protein